MQTHAMFVAAALTAPSPANTFNAEHVERPTLSGACFSCDLSGADLTVLELQRADLASADLNGAVLDGTEILGIEILGARLEGATLGTLDLSVAGRLCDNVRTGGSVHNQEY